MNSKWKILWFSMIVSVHCEGSESHKKVCVIGAGPSGLSSLKQMSMWPNEFEPLAFERNWQIGGQWAYTDYSDIDEHGLPVHSGVYKYMRTNGPRQVMDFPDYPEFRGEARSFVKHQTFLEYLTNYTNHFNLHKYIKFNTFVEKITPFVKDKWIVKSQNLNTDEYEETMCDAVMVCIGIFNKPNIPNIPGIESFPGRILHSHAYRRPEDFTNQTVVILGASSSGIDISFELCSHAKTVYLSHRHEKLQYEMPPNMIQVPGVVITNGSQFILSNGSRIAADSIILCTGYLYDYPFFDTSVGISVEEGKYVHPLYKHFIHVERPTMAFIGSVNAGLALSHLRSGKVKLPSHLEMLKDSELPPGRPISRAHRLSPLEMFDYYDELAKISDAIPLPAYSKPAVLLLVDQLTKNMLHYKEYNYITTDDGQVQLVPIGK